MLDFLAVSKNLGLAISNDLGVSGMVLLTLVSKLNRLDLQDANRSYIIATNFLCLRACTVQSLLEKRAIEDCSLVLTALTADIKPKLSSKLPKLWLQLTDRLAHVCLF